jgi:hypothetical protein
VATVNSGILRIIKDKDRAIKSGTESMLDLLKDLQKQTIDELGRASLDSWDAYHLKQMLYSIGYQIDNFTAKAKSEADGLLKDVWGKGQSLVDLPLAEKGIYMGFHLSTSVLDTLKDFAFHKLEDVSNAAWSKIRGELTLGVLGGKTPQEVATAIGRNLEDPSIFKSIAARAEVITQTEMGRVFSTAAEMRMEEAGQHVDGLEKEWLHSGHPKVPRPEHLAANGQHVPVDEPFIIGGVEMMFPRDPAAPIEETINCG